MFRWMSTLLMGLVALSMTTTATVHARELPAAVSIECTGIVHQDGDADQSQGDADKAVPHHHGTCHGQVANVPVTAPLTLAYTDSDLGPQIGGDSTRPSSPAEPGLRPPSA
jgi:hypothetical protein